MTRDGAPSPSAGQPEPAAAWLRQQAPGTPTSDAFPTDYATARAHFVAAARRAGAIVSEYPIAARAPDGTPLSVAVAVLGACRPCATLVVSSGLHGVEAPAGSAVQTAWLLQQTAAGTLATSGTRGAPPLRVVMLHALNPYGFAWRRRVNENNVDLNRNFLLPGETYSGAAEVVKALHTFIAPATPPLPGTLAWLFWPQAARIISRYGMPALKAALSQGQHEFARGLFFGGRQTEQSTRLVQTHFGSWTGAASRVLHLDLHTGLGRYGRCTLLCNPTARSEAMQWLSAHLGRVARVESVGEGIAEEASVRGGMGRWLEHTLSADPGSDIDYRFATVEFGTCSAVRAFHALREENRAHHHAGLTARSAAGRKLLDVFCPPDPAWRQTVLVQGTSLLDAAWHAIGHTAIESTTDRTRDKT